MNIRKDATLPLTRRELDYLYAQRVERFRERKFRQILPKAGKVPQWAERVEIQKIKMYGDVRPTVRGGSNKPMMPTLDRGQGFLAIFEFEAAYDIRDGELEQVAQLGLGSLPVKKASANQTKAEEILDSIAAVGSTGQDGWPTIPGLANNADAVTDKTTAAGNWTDATDPATILDELHTLADQVNINSKQIFESDTLLLPITTYKFLNRKRIGDGTTDTIMSAFRKEAPKIRRVIEWNPLETAGASSGKRAIAFDSVSEESPKILIPRELTDHEPARSMFGYEIGQTMRTGGVLIENHNSVAYLDGF
jgi:hypothetical protein